MRIGITGATGFIGRELCVALRERGDEVVTFTRSLVEGSDTVRWDPVAGTVSHADLDRVGALDAVVHLAGAGIGDNRWNPSVKDTILSSRTKGTSTLVHALNSRSERPLFLSGSAIGFYGSRGDDIVHETSSPGQGFLSEVCQEWERIAEGYQGKVVRLRTGIVLDRSGGALKKQLPLFRLGLGGTLGSGAQWMSLISHHDLIRAIVFLLSADVTGPVNLVGPAPVTNRTFTSTLARALHRPAVIPAPSLALRVVLGTEMANELLLSSQRVEPRVLTAAGFDFDDVTVTDIVARALH